MIVQSREFSRTAICQFLNHDRYNQDSPNSSIGDKTDPRKQAYRENEGPFQYTHPPLDSTEEVYPHSPEDKPS